MNASSPQQNVLRLFHAKREFVFDTWVADANPHCTHWLQSMLNDSNNQAERLIYLWGQPASGLSHLSQAYAQTLIQQMRPVFYLSLKEPHLSPDVLEDLHAFDWIILDDIACIMMQDAWQEPFIELYHHILKNPHQHLLLTHHCAPQELTGPLFDTVTRIQSAFSLKVDALTSEHHLKKMLIKRAHFRQLSLPERSIDFLLHHTERRAQSLIHVLDHLEQQSLIQKRSISIPFIKAQMPLI